VGTDLQLPAASIIGFLLVLVRTGTWVMVCPPFGTKMVPTQVKVGFSFALALAMAPKLQGQAVPLELPAIVSAAFMQAATGIALGFLGVLLFSAFQSAGSLIDLFGGFATAQLFDPMSGSQASIFGRFYQLMATVLLFATGGHLLLVRGFLATFDAVPASGPSLDVVAGVFRHGITTFFIAAIEIAAPLLAALFLADVALGILAKAAPEMNVLLLGMPLKILLTISLAAVAIPLLPDAVSSLTNQVVVGGLHLAGVR